MIFKMQCRFVLFEPWSGGEAERSYTFCAFGAVRWSAGETRVGRGLIQDLQELRDFSNVPSENVPSVTGFPATNARINGKPGQQDCGGDIR